MPEAPKYEACCHCGEPTGRAGRHDDSIYIGFDSVSLGPFCEECRDDILKWAGDYSNDTLDAARYRFIRDHFVSQTFPNYPWYLNSPWIGKHGDSFEQAIDREIEKRTPQ